MSVRNHDGMRKVKCSSCAMMIWRAGSGGRPRCTRCKKRIRRASREHFRLTHRAEIREYDAKWYHAHKENRSATVARWKLLNPERWAEINRRAAKTYRRKERKENETVLHDLPCMDCGMKHTPEVRQRILRRMINCPNEEIREAWPCVWTNYRTLYRDREMIGSAA